MTATRRSPLRQRFSNPASHNAASNPKNNESNVVRPLTSRLFLRRSQFMRQLPGTVTSSPYSIVRTVPDPIRVSVHLKKIFFNVSVVRFNSASKESQSTFNVDAGTELPDDPSKAFAATSCSI